MKIQSILRLAGRGQPSPSEARNLAPVRLNEPAPAFDLPGFHKGERKNFSLRGFRGLWLILFFYPSDFTFVCPTEATGFNERYADFEKEDAAVAGVSTDGVESHAKWSEELGGLRYPLLSDAEKTTSRAYGVLSEKEGRAFRATFIISPEGRIAHITVSPMNVGRSVEETHRVLAALRTGRLCPANWRPGRETLDPGLKF